MASKVTNQTASFCFASPFINLKPLFPPCSLAPCFRFLFLLVCSFASMASMAQETLVGLTTTGGATGAGTAFSIRTTGSSFTVFKTFVSGGANPYGNDLVRGTDGNFYGMTIAGGRNNSGTVFKMSGTGSMLFVQSLESFSTGVVPYGSLVQASDGNFYGMTSSGGDNGDGTIFKMTTSGKITVIKHLEDATTGGEPHGNLVQGTDGFLYGMTFTGGTGNGGTIFKVSTGGTLTVLKHLSTATGYHPYGSLLLHSDGFFYGMTYQGGTNDYGTIFKVNASGSFSVIRHLSGTTTGGHPVGSLVKANDGNFYGLAEMGGNLSHGTLFRVNTSGTLAVVKHFDHTTMGGTPQGSLSVGSDGALYGLTFYGGTNSFGTVFKCSTTGSFSVLRHFSTADGTNPAGSLCRSTDGNFYGMTYKGGSYKLGTIFRISPTGTFSVLSQLPNSGLPADPSQSLVQGKDGFYYGMSLAGGSNTGHGTVFKLCTNGSLSSLRTFSGSNGGAPNGSLIQGADGNFYGMTTYGGSAGAGTIFRITSNGTHTVLKHLAGATGTFPHGNLVQGSDGNLYGMTYQGGANGSGTIFKLTLSGTYTVLKNLEYASTGSNPYGGLVQGNDGNFYGMTQSGGNIGYGTIFRVTPLGQVTVLKHLDYDVMGAHPQGSLIKGSDGNFYGTTMEGGTAGFGTIFKITPAGSLTVLKNLDNTTTGGSPRGDLVQGGDGVLYGMTYGGGTFDGGTVFRINTSGASFSVLRHLNPITDGANPKGSLVVQKANPVVHAQSLTMVRNTVKKIVLTGSGGTPRTYKVSTAPKNGTATINKDTLFYTPNLNYTGADSVYVTTTWGCQTSTAAKIRINVTATTTASIEAGQGMMAVPEEMGAGGPLQVKAMPNPSVTDFGIVISGTSQPVNIRVLDALGRLVETKSNGPSGGMIRIGAAYKPGLYYVEVVQGKERVVQKLLKAAQ